MSLDTLYGEGTLEALPNVLPEGAEVNDAGGDEVLAQWPDGSQWRIRCEPENVEHLVLIATSNAEGLYSKLVQRVPKFFRDRGVKTFTCRPIDPGVRDILKSRGKWEDAEGERLIWQL